MRDRRIVPRNHSPRRWFSTEFENSLPPVVFLHSEDALAKLVGDIATNIFMHFDDDRLQALNACGNHFICESFFFQHAAIAVVKPCNDLELVSRGSTNEWPYDESISADWYSTKPVEIAEMVTGEALKTFLYSRNLQPPDIDEMIYRDNGYEVGPSS